MNNSVRIYVDFLNADDEGRLILTCAGTIRDLDFHNIQLEEGLNLTFYSDDGDDDGNPDDLIVEGTVHYDKSFDRWTAIIDWNAIKHVSDFTSKS